MLSFLNFPIDLVAQATLFFFVPTTYITLLSPNIVVYFLRSLLVLVQITPFLDPFTYRFHRVSRFSNVVTLSVLGSILYSSPARDQKKNTTEEVRERTTEGIYLMKVIADPRL